MSFDVFGLHPALRKAVDEMGFERSTPVQTAAIPPALQGLDVLGSAQTGSGKTVAYALPILQRLLAAPRPTKPGPRALVLAGSVNNGVGVAVWCLVVVATTDNILRPILIGAEAKLPLLFLFFGMMGGLHVYGFSGIIVGPVVVALFLALIDIYRREYRWLLAPQKEEK